MARLFLMFLDHTQRRSTVGRTPLDEWSARRRDLYLTKHDTHNRQISIPPVGFEHKISAGERPAARRLDYGRSPLAYVNQRLQIQLGLLMMSDIPLETYWAFNVLWNNKFRYQVASCWLLLLSNADIYLLQSHSTCFGRHGTHNQEY